MKADTKRSKGSSLPAKALQIATIVCGVSTCVLVFAFAAMIYVPGEHWWTTSFVLFGPSWLLQVALAGSAAAWLMFHRGVVLGVVLALAELVLLMPVQGYQPPWPGSSVPAGSTPLRLVTWNVQGKLTASDIERLFVEHHADIAVFQECNGLPENAVPSELTLYTHECHGMCMLSRLPLSLVEERDRKDVWAVGGSGAIVRYTFLGVDGPFTLTNVHLETPREGFEELIGLSIRHGISTLSSKNAQRYTEARLAYDWTERGPALPRLVAGDFNTTPQSDLIRDTWGEYSNCFGTTGTGFGHTKVTRWLGVRIDHVLARAPFTCVNTQLLSGFDSDHRPLLAEVTMTSP